MSFRSNIALSTTLLLVVASSSVFGLACRSELDLATPEVRSGDAIDETVPASWLTRAQDHIEKREYWASKLPKSLTGDPRGTRRGHGGVLGLRPIDRA